MFEPAHAHVALPGLVLRWLPNQHKRSKGFCGGTVGVIRKNARKSLGKCKDCIKKACWPVKS